MLTSEGRKAERAEMLTSESRRLERADMLKSAACTGLYAPDRF
jgi:hypothetical protein